METARLALEFIQACMAEQGNNVPFERKDSVEMLLKNLLAG